MDLQKRLAENGYFLVWDEGLIARAARYSGFGIKKLETQDKYLRFEFGSSSFNSLLWGIKQQSGKVCEDKTIWPAISQLMSDQFVGVKHDSNWWPWHSFDHGLGSSFNDWWYSEAPWIAINDGTLSEKILGRAKDFYNLFGDKIDILLPRDASQNK